jgi:ribA/ribD-fused uncharacterized protein
MPLSIQPVKPRGPASNHSSSLSPENPYNFPPQLLAAGRLPPRVTDTHVYFFGYEGSDPHVCFQQWFPCVFRAPTWTASDTTRPTGAEQTFGTTEQYMMHAKAMLMDDAETAKQILEASHPSTAKSLGRKVRNFDQEKWNATCEKVVEEGNLAKFDQNEDLKEVLLGTGNRVIVEASPDDRIWGIGFDAENAEGKEKEWGRNLLGLCLGRVRERLRN